jgi:hypothetical protein
MLIRSNYLEDLKQFVILFLMEDLFYLIFVPFFVSQNIFTGEQKLLGHVFILFICFQYFKL